MPLAYTAEGLADGIVDPLETIEYLIGTQGWTCERLSEEEITAEIPGAWCSYHLRFFWHDDDRVLQTAAIVDLKIPDDKRPSMYEALSMINERLWIGHFELWSEESVLMFRHATLLDTESGGPGEELFHSLIRSAVEECERYYPVFQFILWTGKSAAEAIDAALLETVGEA